MARLIRIDSELVRRGLARSRTHAATLIADGHVTLDGEVVTKPARQVNPAQAIEILVPSGDDYVSRGAHKLAGALDALGRRGLAPRVEGRRCLDAGASTGGFTDVLLRRGAEHVVAVDVGYGQLAWSLRSDPASPPWTAPTSAHWIPRPSPPPRSWSWAICPSSP